VLLHHYKELTFVYKMRLDYDPYHLLAPLPESEPDFWLSAHDANKKYEIRKGIQKGKRYIIAPPFSVQRDAGVFLPIVEKKA
jgi:hypothetical protein